MMVEIISDIGLMKIMAVCMLLDTRDTYPTTSDHIIIICDSYKKNAYS